MAPGSTRPCGCRRASPPSRSPETEPGTRLSPQVLPRSSRRATWGCEPPAPAREEVVGGGWKELRKRVSGELPSCTSDSASPLWVGDGRPLPAEGPAHRTSGPVLGCAEPLKDLVGKRFLMRLGLCRGGWTGNEGLHACGALSGPRVHCCSPGAVGAGRAGACAGIPESGCVGGTPLRWPALFGALAALVFSLARCLLWSRECLSCRAWRWAGHPGRQGPRDATAPCATLGTWAFHGGQALFWTPDECADCSRVKAAPPPPRPRKDPKPLLPSSKCLWIMYIQMSSCQLHGENILFELDGI